MYVLFLYLFVCLFVLYSALIWIHDYALNKNRCYYYYYYYYYYVIIIIGSLTDKAVKSSKRRAAEASLDKVVIGSDPPLENVPNFEYLGSRLQGDGSDEADVRHSLEIAQSAFNH